MLLQGKLTEKKERVTSACPPAFFVLSSHKSISCVSPTPETAFPFSQHNSSFLLSLSSIHIFSEHLQQEDTSVHKSLRNIAFLRSQNSPTFVLYVCDTDFKRPCFSQFSNISSHLFSISFLILSQCVDCKVLAV